MTKESPLVDSKVWRERLAIHLQNLHGDVATHAAYYAEIAELGAELKAQMHQARAQYDLMKAEVDADIRLDPEKFGLPKVTEAALQAAVIADKRVRTAHKDVLRTQRDSDMVQVLVTAFEHRRSMLNNEVQLYIANYWEQAQAASVGEKEDRAALRKERQDAIVRRRIKK